VAGRLAIADLKAYLAGPWRVRRRIDDRRRDERGSFEGGAAFCRERQGLRYRERGVLRLNGYEGEAGRDYVYAFPIAAVAEVYFDDGRFFHALDLSGGAWSVEHRCGDDLYRGDFAVDGKDRWRVVWRVDGPRKALILDAEYRRTLV
jgi:hypothetical protein